MQAYPVLASPRALVSGLYLGAATAAMGLRTAELGCRTARPPHVLGRVILPLPLHGAGVPAVMPRCRRVFLVLETAGRYSDLSHTSADGAHSIPLVHAPPPTTKVSWEHARCVRLFLWSIISIVMPYKASSNEYHVRCLQRA